MKKKLLLLAAMLVSVSAAWADMFEPSPDPLQESSQNVKIVFHAEQSGVDKLQNLNSDLYAHIGVWTEKGDWQHVKGAWSDNTADKVFKRVAANTYELTIGDIRTYFGITDANEHAQKICVIARTADGNAQTKDVFLDVHEAGYAMSMKSDPANTVFLQATTVKFTVSTTANSTIKLYVNNEVKQTVSNTKTLTYSQSFNSPGSWNVKAVATNGTETIEQQKSVLYIAPSPAQNYPGGTPKQGAVKNSDGSVTFCLAAPGKSNVTIVGSWDNYLPTQERVMKYQDYNGYRYFWTTVSGLKASTYYPYYYLVDGKYKVSDPYGHLILDYASDKWLKDDSVFPDCPAYPYDIVDDAMMAVYKSDLDDYNWKVTNFKVDDPKSLTIYELLLRDFTGTDATADGTVRAAIEKIPYLKQLGVTAVELLPIMQFDGNNSWGYNTNNYMAPDKSYGSPADYKEFIDKCHQAGIAVILDIVFNHTPGLHPWYAMYESGTSPFYNASAPHDYSVYEDIKQEYPLVEQHWIDVLTYWLTVYKVDGFRFDLVKGLGDSNSYGGGTEAYNQSRINRMARLHAAMKAVNPNVIHINENLASAQEETPMGNDGQLNWNNQSYHSYRYAQGVGGDLKYMNSANCGRPKLSTVDYMESHDEERVSYKQTSAGGNNTAIKGNIGRRMLRLGSAAAQMLMQPGPKMIWMFGELGADETTKSGSGNNTSPKKLCWNNLNNADKAALHDNYSDLCNLRRYNAEMFGAQSPTPVFSSGFGDNATQARSIKLTSGDKEIVLFANPSITAGTSMGITVSCSKLSTSNYQVISASKGFEPVVQGNGTTVNVTVPANSFCVLATKNICGVEEVLIDGAISGNATVTGGNGCIVINGDYTNAEVYNMAGVRMGSLNVAPGLYIVNVDGNVTKVMVR